MEEAFRLAKEAGDNTNLMRAYNNIATTRSATRGPAATAEVLREGLELALRSGHDRERRMDRGQPRRRRCSSSAGSRRARSTSGSRSTSRDASATSHCIGQRLISLATRGADARSRRRGGRDTGTRLRRSWRRTPSRRRRIPAAVRRVPGASRAVTELPPRSGSPRPPSMSAHTASTPTRRSSPNARGRSCSSATGIAPRRIATSRAPPLRSRARPTRRTIAGLLEPDPARCGRRSSARRSPSSSGSRCASTRRARWSTSAAP